MVWTSFAPCRLARATSANATQKVTTLYAPFTRPVHAVACSYRLAYCVGSEVFRSWVAPKTDSPTDSVTYCQ